MKKADFFSKLEKKCPSDDDINRTKHFFKSFNIEKGEELTQLYLESDIIFLADVFETFIKVSTKEYGINPFCCVSLPGYTYQCALKWTDIKLQTLQDKDLILTKGNNMRGGISSVKGDRYVKSNGNKKILYIDTNNLYGHCMSQPLPYDEIEMWHGHPDLYMIKLEEILNTPDDSDIGYFVEVVLRYHDNLEEKTKIFSFCAEKKIFSSR